MDVGVIGLGAMGTPMAHNLLDADLLTVVYNRTRSKTAPFADQDVTVVSAPAALAEQVEIVFVMVTDDDALHEVLEGPQGLLEGLPPDTIAVNTSTVSTEATEAAAHAVQTTGGRFVDAPVNGTIGPAEAGTLTVLAGAASSVLDEVHPALEVIGDPIVHCGPVGTGTKTKLFTNLLLKDFNLIAEAAAQQGIYLPQTASTREAISGAQALGHGDEDMMAVIKLLESIADTTAGANDAD